MKKESRKICIWNNGVGVNKVPTLTEAMDYITILESRNNQKQNELARMEHERDIYRKILFDLLHSYNG